MQGHLEGHSCSLKFWVPSLKQQILSAPPFINQPKISGNFPPLPTPPPPPPNIGGREVADTMKCMYSIQLTTSTDFITISVRNF